MSTILSSFEAILTAEELAALLQDEDRRYCKRIRFTKTVQITPLNDCTESVWGTVTDLSRDGLYFTSRSNSYQVGMELRVTFQPGAAEYCCRVVRTEELPGGRTGVGACIIRW
jgi:PilZ domain-containing protein